MTRTRELSPRRHGFKYLLLFNLTAVMLAAPCLAESEWPPAEAQDQIQTINPEDLQPQSFEASPPAEFPEETPVEIPAAGDIAPEVPLPEEPQPTMETPADVPAETAPAETPAVPPDAAIEAPPENPAEAPAAEEIPAAAETASEGVLPQFSENPIIDAPEDPPPPPEP